MSYEITPKKILVIKFRSFGDTVLLTAPLRELREAYPKAKIHVAVTSQWASILENHPAINHIWPYERREDKASRAKTITHMALKLRKEKYDLVVNFHASPSSAMLAFAVGAKVRSIHFHGHKTKNRYSTVEIPGKGTIKPIIERDMDAIRALGLRIPNGRYPEVFLTAEETNQAVKRLGPLNLKKPILALGVGASRPTKIWPTDRFASLAVSWCLQTKGSAIALGGPGEEALIQDFSNAVDDQLEVLVSDPSQRQELKKSISHVTQLNLRELAAVLKECHVFAGNDSGPKHLAVAVKTPTVSIIGPEHPYEWHPYPRDIHPYLFIENLPCRRDALPGMPPWCGLQVCVEERHQCMQLIRVEQVLTECKRVVKQ